MSINQATSECVSNLESERINNPKSYETMFAIPVASKFGGLKKRSQVMQSVSGMKSDEKDFSNTAVIKVENLEKICNFHPIEITCGSQVISVARKLSSKLCLMCPDQV